uniref:Uncharacterized protein n=1 Tax=Schizaphis graminum TaxID=13262 RepID=A0A2S2PGM7_SCHGA
MMHLCLQTMVLLACFCSAIGTIPMSVYDKKLELLSSVVKHDYLWRSILLEKVYYTLGDTYYKHIIEDELLVSTQDEAPDTGKLKVEEPHIENTSEPFKTDTQVQITPYTFIRNIFSKRRFVVGSILDMGLEVLKVSYKCLLYKHLVYFNFLIRVEMSRKQEQKKAINWSRKSKNFFESIIMTMGALQFSDLQFLNALSFFEVYQMTIQTTVTRSVKTQFINQLNERNHLMLEYVKHNCVERPTFNNDVNSPPEMEIAAMLGFKINNKLYKASQSFNIADNKFKDMIVSSRKKIIDDFGSTPRINGMSKTLWYEILYNFNKI